MTGKTHKIIGIAAGGAIAYYGYVYLNEPLYAMALLTAPVGAMIPDIDHNGTKLGSQRKRIFNIMTTLLSIVLPVAAMVFLILGYLRGALLTSLITIVIIIIPFIVLYLLSQISFVKKNLQFAAKHRGFMHTAILPVFMYIAAFVVTEPVFSAAIKGLFAGYITHLFADMLTIRGCPVLYPVTKRNINLAKIKTGSIWEYIAASVIIAGIIILTLLPGYIG